MRRREDWHSGEIRASRVEGNKRNEERGTESVDPSFPRIPLIYILSWHRKKRRRKKPAREVRAVEGAAARYQPFVCAADAKLC